MAKHIVKLPSGYRVTESFLVRVLIEGEGDTLDMMALKELAPMDLKFVLSTWLNKQIEGNAPYQVSS